MTLHRPRLANGLAKSRLPTDHMAELRSWHTAALGPVRGIASGQGVRQPAAMTTCRASSASYGWCDLLCASRLSCYELRMPTYRIGLWEMSLQYPANIVLSAMRQLAIKAFDGAVSDMMLFGHSADDMPDFSGFCVNYAGNLALVELGTKGIPDWQWAVQVTSGLAAEVPTTFQLIRWINDHNRRAMHGKYYCTGDGHASAVMYETMIWGGNFKITFDDQDSDIKALTAGRIRWEMEHIIRTGAEESIEVINLFGGRPFNCSPDDMHRLFAMSA